MDKIIEISLSKIENSKTKVSSSGKTSALHRHLLVNSVLNRVRCNDKISIDDSLMKYREPRSMVDMDIDDCEIEKVPILQEKTTLQRTSSVWKQTSIPALSLKETTDLSNTTILKERNENVPCECNNNQDKLSKETNHRGKKRHATIKEDEYCLSKKLRKTSNQEVGGALNITSLVSLFDDLVADNECDRSKSFEGSLNRVATVVALC